MIKWVQKRDGRIVAFRAEKIADAIFAAAKAVGGEDRRQAEVLAGQVIHLLQQTVLAQEVPQVEDVQDLVEKVLIEEGHARTAKAFILYRNQRTRIRDAKSELMDVVSEIFQESGTDAQVTSTPLGKLQRIAVAASERYALHNLLPRDFSLAHQRARMHIDRLGHYATAVAGAVVDLHQLLHSCQLVGRIQVPQLRAVDDLEQAIQALIVAAQSETIGELLFANIDQVFAVMCHNNQFNISQAQAESFASHLLTNINLALMAGTAESLKVGISVGLEAAPAGQLLTQSLLRALEQSPSLQASLVAPQIIYQLREGINLSQGDVGYATSSFAQQVAKQRGNPSLVLSAADDNTRFLAGGARLDKDAPILLSRTHINLPRLALEADNERDFLASIDAIFSLAAKQAVHRSEILSALQPADLPLTASQLCEKQLLDNVRRVPLLTSAMLLLVPVGIQEALQVVQQRFASSFSSVDFINLLNEICEHWRSYYSLNLQIGVVPSTLAARRFFAYDINNYPLVKNLWPEASSYSCMVSGDLPTLFTGGQLALWPSAGQIREGLVYMQPIQRTICLRCGSDLAVNGETECPQCHGYERGTITQEDGYLVLNEELIANL